MAKRSSSSTPNSAKATGGFTPENRIVLLHGPDLLLRTEHTAALKKVLEGAHGEVDVLRFSGADADAATVLDECRSFGLIAAHKLVILDEAEQLIKGEDIRPLFERYADNPSPGATLLIRSGTWRPGNLDKQIAKVGLIIKCSELDKPEAHAWVVRRAKDIHGVSIDRPAATELVERIGSNLAQLDIDLAKLALAAVASGSKTITIELVKEFVVLTKEIKPWEAAEYLLSGSAQSAIGSMRKTIETSPRGAEIPLLYACSSTAQSLHAAAVAHRLRIPIGEFAKQTLTRGTWAVEKPFRAASSLAPEKTAPLLTACVRADAHSKSGVGRPDRLIEMLAIEFARTASKS